MKFTLKLCLHLRTFVEIIHFWIIHSKLLITLTSNFILASVDASALEDLTASPAVTARGFLMWCIYYHLFQNYILL